MACISSLLSEEQFLCSICLDVFTDPVAIPCGHNYCKTCITHNWDRGNERCECPICKEVFDRRPELRVNTFISEIVAQFRESVQVKTDTDQEPAEPDEVSCDVCTETKLKALKSCLVCQISYCETHLEPHRRVTVLQRHKLIDPVKNLEDMMCKKHDRPLELFCKTDHMCVCQFCTESDHKQHQIVSLEDECEGKKAELRKTEAEVQQMIQERQLKIQEVKHSVELSRKETGKEIEDTCVQVFTALMNCIEKHKTTEKQAEGFVKELEKDISELKKRSAELEKLSHTEDHLHLLQHYMSINTPPPTKDWTKVNVHQFIYEGTVRTTVAQLEKTLGKEMEKLYDAELRRIQQYAVDVTLDPDTAQRYLLLSEDGKQVHFGDVKKNLPNNKQRFSSCPNVLGQSFSGKFYYEVQVKEKTCWTIGVARESIKRKGPITLSPNNGYWTMSFRNGNAFWAAAGPPVLLPVREKLQKVGVFVDYEEGLVSFYDVEARVHVYSFTGCTFTEKLYPYFSPCFNKSGKNSAPLIISPLNHTD